MGFTAPQDEHAFDDGSYLPIVATDEPYHAVLYSSCRRSSPNAASSTERFSPDFAATFFPGFSTVPLAERVIPDTFKSSIATTAYPVARRLVSVFTAVDRCNATR